jgi:hypothetical protein
MNINENESIWMERYRPVNTNDLVLPDVIKSKFMQYAKNEDIPNLGLWSNNPGCVLPGTSIQVQANELWMTKKEVINTYKIDNKGYTFIKKYASVKKTPRRDFLDANTITSNLLKLSKSNYKYKQYYKFDKNFTNKFMKFDYWLCKFGVETAYKKVKKLRKYKDYFEFDKNNLHKKVKNFKTYDDILRAQMKIVYTNISIPESSRKIDFWTFRGWTEEEAIEKIKSIQDNSEHIDYEERINNTDITYYLNKGLTETEAKDALSERQCTFSLRKCIDKYGDEIGLDVFNARQLKWQKTLNSKSQKEMDKINMSKGHKPNIKGKCNLYYIRIYDSDIEFFKIGITTRTINERWSSLKKSGLKYNVIIDIEFDSVESAYKVEQAILKNSKRKIIEHNYFRSTECFEKDIRDEI